MNINLQIYSDSLSPNTLQDLTRQVYQSIKKETKIQVNLDEQFQDNTKGEVINTGTIILTFITGGGAVALINVLKSYIDRGSRLEMTLEKDGKKLSLNSINTDSSQIDQTIDLLSRFFDAEK